MSRFHIYETRIKFLEMKRELFSSFPILHFQFRFAYNFPLSMQCNYACNAVCNRPRYLVESKLITVTWISPVFYFTNIPLVTPPVRLLFIALTILEVFLLTEDRDVNENVPFEISSARGNAWPESENEPRYNDKCKLDDSPETDFKVTRPLEWGMIIVFIFLSFFFSMLEHDCVVPMIHPRRNSNRSVCSSLIQNHLCLVSLIHAYAIWSSTSNFHGRNADLNGGQNFMKIEKVRSNSRKSSPTHRSNSKRITAMLRDSRGWRRSRSRATKPVKDTSWRKSGERAVKWLVWNQWGWRRSGASTFSYSPALPTPREIPPYPQTFDTEKVNRKGICSITAITLLPFRWMSRWSSWISNRRNSTSTKIETIQRNFLFERISLFRVKITWVLFRNSSYGSLTAKV